VFAPLVPAEQTPSPGNPADFDVIFKGGTVYDATGPEPKHVDVAIRGDRIAAIGEFGDAHAKTVIDAKGAGGRAWLYYRRTR
jgi:adenine deaminase